RASSTRTGLPSMGSSATSGSGRVSTGCVPSHETPPRTRARRRSPRSGSFASPAPYHPGVAAPIRIGTCSWADESLTRYFYPPGVKGAEDRLRYYADRFDTVEANSTYYSLPAEEMVRRWHERTPEGFVMHVKAFGVMTRHPVKVEQLPPDLRQGAPVDERGRVDRPPREFRAEVFRRFLGALEPLRAAGKLGGILFKLASLDYLEWAKNQLGGDELLLEFRHRSWLDDENRAETLDWLERIGAT